MMDNIRCKGLKDISRHLRKDYKGILEKDGREVEGETTKQEE